MPVSVCPSGQLEVECEEEDLCAQSACEDAVCEVDNCGVCSIRWYRDGVDVTDQCEQGMKARLILRKTAYFWEYNTKNS